MANVPYSDLNETFKSFATKENLGEEERHALWQYLVSGDATATKEPRSIQETLDAHERLLIKILESIESLEKKLHADV